MGVNVGSDFLLQATVGRSVVWTIGPVQPERVAKWNIGCHFVDCSILHVLCIVGFIWYLHVCRIRTDEGCRSGSDWME